MTLPLWARVGKAKLAENSPTILSGLAVSGLVATVALAIRATPVAMEKVNKLREVKYAEGEPLMESEEKARNNQPTAVDIIKATWKCYIPAGIAGAASIACIVGANQVGLRQKAALAGAYSLVEVAFREYKDEVVKTLGEKKEQAVHDKIAERKIQENIPDAQVIIVGGEDQLCYDELTGRYFRSTAEKIRQAEIDLKTAILKDMFVDHNYWHSLLDLEGTVIGEALGWNINHMPDIILGAHMSPKGQPCLSVRFRYLPSMDYLKYH